MPRTFEVVFRYGEIKEAVEFEYGTVRTEIDMRFHEWLNQRMEGIVYGWRVRGGKEESGMILDDEQMYERDTLMLRYESLRRKALRLRDKHSDFQAFKDIKQSMRVIEQILSREYGIDDPADLIFKKSSEYDEKVEKKEESKKGKTRIQK